MLENYEPKTVLKFFEEISKIPRGSGNEKGISDWLVAFAKARGLWAHQDKAFNVVVKKPGTKGLENAPTVIIQGHTDMVCEKNAATKHDFEKDPLQLTVDGDFLKARGTTLGADNGAAVVMALALLDSKDIPHPPIEALFTAGEEIGLIGAGALDGSLLKGRILLNIDSEEEGIFFASCAGGGRADLSYPIEYCDVPSGFLAKTLVVRGLKGGHSGLEITQERGNSCRILARILRILQTKFAVQFTDIGGGSKHNAIPRESQAVIVFDAAKEKEIASEVAGIEAAFKREFSMSDAGLTIGLETCGNAVKKMFAQKLCKNLVTALLTIPNGVEAMSLAIEGLPETSLNIGVITTTEKEVVLTCSLRSSVVSRKEMLAEQLRIVSETTGATIALSGFYPAWEYDNDSPLRKKAMRIFKEMFGKEAEVSGTHGGLECGIFCEKLDGVDIISFGPNIYNAHTPDEKMSLSSFKRMWDFLQKLLAQAA